MSDRPARRIPARTARHAQALLRRRGRVSDTVFVDPGLLNGLETWRDVLDATAVAAAHTMTSCLTVVEREVGVVHVGSYGVRATHHHPPEYVRRQNAILACDGWLDLCRDFAGEQRRPAEASLACSLSRTQKGPRAEGRQQDVSEEVVRRERRAECFKCQQVTWG